MENPGNPSGEPAGAVEDPPPPAVSGQEQSTSESSSQPQQEQQRPPPPPLSPLTGSYLLIVVGEPHSERHKEIILQKIAKAFLSWDVAECHVSLEKELQIITGQSPEGEEARFGERLIQYATENLVTEILIHPQLNTLHQCLKNLLSSFTKHRHIIHAGYTFAGNGSWILQDGTLSISDLIEALHEPDVLRVLKAYENSVSIDVHCAPEGEWSTERFQKEPVSKLCSVRINPGDVMTAGDPAISAFIDYLSPFLEPANIQHLLQPTDVVGNIRFTHPTLYVFPGGQGDAALFGINGFNMLIDGGFARKACFWDFARHLDRLDAVLLTRLNNSTVNGISAVLQRKKMNHVYPQIGHFFCNLQDRKIALSPDGHKDKDSLIVNLAEEGQEIVANLRHLALKPHPCYRDGNQVDPVNLYHKVGHGKLDMYVISPARDSQAVKDFLAKWSSNDSHLFSNTGKKTPGKAFEFPLQNLVSICALLVWQPANPNDTITRILFPGSTPQHKIFEGLEKLRHLEFLKHPVCSAKSISPSVSAVTVTRSLSKTRQPKPADNQQKEAKTVSKPQAKPAKPKMEKTPPKELKSKLDNKLAEEKGELENLEEPLKKLNNRILSKDEQIENIKKEIRKIEQAENEEQKKKIVHRSKYDMRNVKSKVDSRAPSKSVDRKKILEKKPEGEASPPGTPKKSLQNGTATKAEKAKVAAKSGKVSSPTSTPAKSAKEANNRKVVESRVTTRSSSKSLPRKKEETPPPAPPAVAKAERKPISRRPKAPLSPAKSALGKPKTDPDSVPKKLKKKSDVDSTVVKAIGQTISKELEKGAETEKTEIGEGVEGRVEIKKLEADTTENKETETKAVKKESEIAQFEVANKEEEEEEEEEEEYLIITKEEYGEDSAKEDESGKENEEEAQTKDETEGEGEMKKLLREEEESEKKREKGPEERVEDEGEREGEEEKKEVEEEQKEPEMNVEDQPNDEGRRAESPGEKSPEGRESELQRLMEVDEGIDLKEPASKEHREGESLPEEKMSNTLETSATTAPTLPEDERMEEPADVQEGKEQREDVKEVVEEKYIQEKTKEEKREEEEEEEEEEEDEEEEVKPEQPQVPTAIDMEGSPLPVQTPRKHPRDVVKTPDEVAELPMHEEVDPRMYSSGDYLKELQRKPEEEKHYKPDFRTMVKGEANILDEEEDLESQDLKKPPEEKVEDPVVTKYLNIIDELERSATESKKEILEKVVEEKAEKDEPALEGAPVDDAKPEFEGVKEKDVETDDVRDGRKLDLEEADFGRSPGESTPQKKDASGKSTPLEGEKEPSGKATPVGLEEETAGEGSPQDLVRKTSGRSTPHERELSGKSTPQEMEKEVAGESTPSAQEKDSPEKTAPQKLDEKLSAETLPEHSHEILDKPLATLEKDASGKPPSKEVTDDESKKSILQSQERDVPEESVPQDVERGTSRKSSLKELGDEISDKPTALEICKDVSGKTTPELIKEDMLKQSSGNALVRDLSPSPTCESAEKEIRRKSSRDSVGDDSEKVPIKVEQSISLKSTPRGSLKDVSGKSTPQDLVEDLSGKATPQDLPASASGKVTPKEIAEELREESTPQDLVKDVSRKLTPEELAREASGRSTPQELVKDVSGKSTPQELAKEVSGKSTPQDLAADVSGKSTPHELIKDLSGKSTPQDFVKDTSGKSTPHDLAKEISGKSTPQELIKETSGKSTPRDLIKEMSGKSTPQEYLQDVSGKSTPQELVKDSSVKSTDVSGKSTPQELLREVSGKSTPQEIVRDVSGKSTPQDLVKEMSGKSTPQESIKEISGKSTPLDLVKEMSGKSTPQDLHEMSGKSTPQEFIKETSGKSTPQELIREMSGKSTPLDLVKEMSGKSTPQELEKELSGKSTPQELIKEMSGKSTPLDLVKEISGKSTPQELEKEISGKFTPQELVKEVSGKSTPENLGKDLSGKTTPGKESPEIDKEFLERTKPVEVETPRSGKSTPGDGTGKTTPLEGGIIASGKSSHRTSPAPSSPLTAQDLGSTITSHSFEGSEIAENLEQEKTKGEREIEEERVEAEEAAKPTPGKATPEDRASSGKDVLEKLEEKMPVGKKAFEGSVSESVSSGQGEKDTSGKSTPFSTDREISGKISPPAGGKATSDSYSLALAEKGTSGTCSLEKQTSEKVSSPSPVDISPLSLDEVKEGAKEKDVASESVRSPEQREGRKSVSESLVSGKSQVERLKCEEGGSSGTSTPDRSHYEKSEASIPNGTESDEEPEKGILESERQEKESQILDVSSGEEEELKALGDDDDSDVEMRRDNVEGETVSHVKEIAKGEKDDINQLVKSGGGAEAEEEQDSEKKTGVKRMLVTASSEDGGTETEICIKSGGKAAKEEMSDGEEKEDEKKDEKADEDEGDFSNLILQAREEYNAQRSRKTSCNSSEEVEEAEETVEREGEEEEELGSLLQQARQELAFVRLKNREMMETDSATSRQKYETKTTTRSETTRMDDDHDIITITTILTEEREEQEDGSVRITTTKETTTTGGKNEGTVTTVNTNVEKKDEKKTEDDESSSQMNSSGEQRGGKRSSREDGEGKVSQEEAMETSRRTSASSIISQEDLVSRKDSAKIEDFRQSSTEMSPLKTTYITSCGDSESLMTSSFYGNLPTEDEMIGKAEHLREFRKGRGYESFTEVGPNGERTERTYFYGGEEDSRGGKERSRYVKTYYTEEGQQKEGEQSRFVHRFYASDIPEEETVEKTRFVQRLYAEETPQSEPEGKFRFVSEAAAEHVDFAKAVDEHVSVRGEYLGKEDVSKYGSGKSKEEEEGAREGGSKADEEKEKDVIEGWGKPLGLPLPPKNTYKGYAFPGQNISTTSTLSTPTDNSDSVNNWGQPMNLPSPAPPPTANGTVDTLPGKATKETPKKEKKVPPKKNVPGDNKSSGTNTPNRRSESPVKQIERRTPSTGRNRTAPNSFVYLDLTYVPHHGNSYYSNVEFFKKVRARYYVFSGTEPSKEVYNALLEAKQTWEDKKLEVTIIPTYDTDVLGYWVAENEEILAQHKIDLSPSASRCTINLQDHETSCSAYRLEF